MAPLSSTDVVIIGMGGTGGIAAYVLAQAGLSVVGLEAGPRLGTADFVKRLDEVGESFSLGNSLGGPKFNKELPTWRPNAQVPTQPYAAVGMANCVGGSTVHYGAQFWRFLEDDFTYASSTIARYGAGAIPAGTAVADWPITYADLEPYYTNVEYAMGVSGQEGADPFAAPRSRPYPMPPVRPFPFADKMAGAMSSLGYHPFPMPAAINSVSYGGRPACTMCGFCGYGFGCWNESKASTLTTIAAAEKTGKLEVRPNSRVMSIDVDSSGRASGVTYMDENGQTQVQPAGFVILGTYVYENSRLLLLSKSAAYPNGLSNNEGQVGKYYRPQAGAEVYGNYSGKKLNAWGGTSGQGIAMDDLNGDNFDHTGLGFIRGANVQMTSGNMPVGQSTSVPPTVPLWGSAYKRWLAENAGSTIGMLAQMETLPYEANFIDLDPVKKDDLGIPVARVTFSVYENEQNMAAYLTSKMVAMHKANGAKQVWGGLSVSPIYSHAYGGTVMGNESSSSVVNQYSISHEVPNLAILGGSTFVSVSGYNPTHTMQALAWLSAEYIANNFNSLAA